MTGKAKEERDAGDGNHKRAVEAATASWARITERELLAADILLSLRTDPSSQLVRSAGNGWYSHAALWTGESVIEVTTQGVKIRSLAESLRGVSYCHAYRVTGLEGDKRKAIVEAAMAFEGGKYAFNHFMLMLATGVSMMAIGETSDQQMEFSRIVASALNFKRKKRPLSPEAAKFLTCVALVAIAYHQAGVPLEVDIEPKERVTAPFRVIAKGLIIIAKRAHQASQSRPVKYAVDIGRTTLKPLGKLLGVPPTTMMFDGGESTMFTTGYKDRIKVGTGGGHEWPPELTTPEMIRWATDIEPIGVVIV